jgi:hypothetical protein
MSSPPASGPPDPTGSSGSPDPAGPPAPSGPSGPPGSGDWPDPYAPTQDYSAPTAAIPPASFPAAYPLAAYGPPPPAPPGYGYPPPAYPYPAAPPTNGLAIASLVCSLAGLAICLSAPVGAILGHIARRQIRERGEQGDGMALAGIIVGWVLTGLTLVFCLFYLVVFGFIYAQEPDSF